MDARLNLTGRAGRWSAEHPWRAIGMWLAFVVIAVMAGAAIGTSKLDQADLAAGESARAIRAMEASFGVHPGENVLIRSNAQIVTDPGSRVAIEDLVSKIRATGRVTNVHSPFDPAHRNQISPDGKAALITFDVRGSVEDGADNVGPVLNVVEAAAKTHPHLRIEEAGTASLAKGLNDATAKDFKRAELISVPLALLVLLITFGALVAALLPLGLALTSVAGASGLLAFTSHIAGVDSAASTVMLLIGLAVGVDYSMFYVKREREERAKGLSPHDALVVAASTSGRSVLISGITVLIALCGMFIVQDGVFTGLTEGALLVVAASIVGSLTVLPALLSLLGDRVERGRIPFIGRFRHPEGESRIWGWVVTRTLARPVLSLTLGVLALAVLALPALRMHTAQEAASDLPRGIPVVQSNDHLQKAFPGSGTPATVVVTGPDVTAPTVTDAIDQLTQQAIRSGTAHEPVSVRVSGDHTATAITLPLAGNGENDASKRALSVLRDRLIPATLGAVAGVKVDVTGSTATNADVTSLARARTPLVFAFVLVLAFALLVASFRSVVIAAKAIVLNLLSVVAAYGVLVAVFQWGWGESILRFHSTGAIVSGLPVFLFVVLFSLSMDYHVFIVSRIREAMTGGMSTDNAVVHAVKSTAGVVTAAAAVMVMTFAVFATLRPVSSKEFGIGLGVAVLLDATIVRGVLLPSAMKLLGEWNWYLPRWLEWIPQSRHEPHIITLPDVPKQRDAAETPAFETELT